MDTIDIPNQFFEFVVDSMTKHIAVINQQGDIVYVNKGWKDYASKNDCVIESKNWLECNYIDECKKAQHMGDSHGKQVLEGLHSVLKGDIPEFNLDYPCHSAFQKQWFHLHIVRFEFNAEVFCVINHQDITDKKLAEEELTDQAKKDGLTKLFNRRYFEEFLNEEWRRCERLSLPLSIALIDFDHFKLLNDTYGHHIGDKCLISISRLFSEYTNRPSDICARYGGEEFIFAWGNTDIKQAYSMATQIRQKVEELKIDNKNSPTSSYVTVSIGLATVVPTYLTELDELIQCADDHLYQAKNEGRNCVKYCDLTSELKLQLLV